MLRVPPSGGAAGEKSAAGAPGTERKLSLADLPAFCREQLGLGGVNLSTDMLAGTRRADLEKIRERGDRAGCAVLLLYEPEIQDLSVEDEDEVTPRINRLLRVVEAAQILGCASVACRVKSGMSDEQVESTVDRLKIVVEGAEKYDLNLLVAPSPGLTAEPDRLTDLIKRVGGFRIGTMPDILAATETKDPITYLRRLTPYASAVLATTFEFEDASTAKPPPALPSPQAKAKGKSKDEKDDKKSAAKPKPAPVIDEDVLEDDEEGLEDLLKEMEELVGEEGEDESEAEPEPEFVHTSYDMIGLMNAVRSVGYDGNLAVNYRGPGDPTVGVVRTRRILQKLLASPLLD